MHRPLARLAGLLTVAAALSLGSALPAAAYAPDDAVTVSATTTDPGGSVRLSVQDGTFVPGEPLTITARGENAGGIAFALVRTAVETATHAATANTRGGMDAITLTFPTNASGAYTIAVFSPSSPGDTVIVTVGSLSVTGLDGQSLLGIWVGGGALVAAGVVVLVSALVTRHRRAADAA